MIEIVFVQNKAGIFNYLLKADFYYISHSYNEGFTAHNFMFHSL